MKNNSQNEKNNQKDLKKTHLLNDHSFDALVQLQQEIAAETGWMPTLNKLVNALVNGQTLPYLKKIILQEFDDRQKLMSSSHEEFLKK